MLQLDSLLQYSSWICIVQNQNLLYVFSEYITYFFVFLPKNAQKIIIFSGTPSRLISYCMRSMCAKFYHFIQQIHFFLLSDYTIMMGV